MYIYKQMIHYLIQFRRFLEDRVKLNKQYPDLYDRFEKLGYDDIRGIVDLDNETLKEEIGLKAFHCKTFMRKIKVFQNEANAVMLMLHYI